LYQKLVKEKEVAVGVAGSPDERVGPGLFRFMASIPAGKQPEDALKLLDEEVARMRAEPVTEKELLRARTSARRSQISPRTSVLSRAISLADDAVLFNDPGRLNSLERRASAVTADQIRQVAERYLRPENRIVIVTVPAAPVGAPKPPGAKAGAE